jgi:hypothetical protein
VVYARPKYCLTPRSVVLFATQQKPPQKLKLHPSAMQDAFLSTAGRTCSLLSDQTTRSSRDRSPVHASPNSMKNCLASWLHSAESEAIACRSKVIDGRIMTHCGILFVHRASRVPRNVRGRFRATGIWGDIFLDACDNFPRPVDGRQSKEPFERIASAGFCLGRPAASSAMSVSFSPKIGRYRLLELFHRRFGNYSISVRDYSIVDASGTKSR